MRKFNKIFILLAFFGVSVISTAQVVDSGTCGNNLTWELTGAGNNLTLTISGTGEMANYYYDYDIQAYNMPWRSQCTNIKTLIISNGVTSIGIYAFYHFTGLTEVTIPNSVTLIGENAFYYCTSLTEVTIPNSVTSIENYAFGDCTSLQEVTIPNSVISIREYAFFRCTGLTAIIVSEDNQNYSSEDGVVFNKNKTTLTMFPAGKTGTYTIPNSVTTIGDNAFCYCTSLTKVIIPNSVTSIGRAAFFTCTGLMEAVIPNSITSIGGYAFSSCGSLTEATIPDLVTSIEMFTFNGCVGLTKLTIPNSVSYIGQGALGWCIGLTDIYVYWETPVNIDADIFGNVTISNIKLHIPEGTKPTYQNAPVWQDFILLDGTEAGINNILSNSISLYPNPVKEELIIESGELKINNVEICDLAGCAVETQLIASLHEATATINVSSLLQGVYLVKIYTDKGVKVERVIKN